MICDYGYFCVVEFCTIFCLLNFRETVDSISFKGLYDSRFCAIIQGRQCLLLLVCFLTHDALSQKGSTL